jgi:hypothetical protein
MSCICCHLNCSASKQIANQRQRAFLSYQMRECALSDLQENRLCFGLGGKIGDSNLKENGGLVDDVGVGEHVVHLKMLASGSCVLGGGGKSASHDDISQFERFRLKLFILKRECRDLCCFTCYVFANASPIQN